ncbi:MAG TPA: hypothetical protein VMZ53_21655 [Kofleriaceae bacterium]|nr:hypothetical protein [Kofleriaceae bacterium]
MYRDPAFVEVTDTTSSEGPPPIAIWGYFSRLLACDRGRDPLLPIRSLVYTGEPNMDEHYVRRVSLGIGGYLRDWDEKLVDRDVYSNGFVGRIGDLVIIPRTNAVAARELETGNVRWELAHPAKLHRAPMRRGDDEVFLAFADRTWLRVTAADGTVCERGAVRSEEELDALVEKATELSGRHGDAIWYGGHTLKAWGGVYVQEDDDPSRSIVRYERAAPAVTGDIAIDGWEADDYIDLIGDSLVVWLKRTWGDTNHAALAFVDPTSIALRSILELGPIRSFRSAYRVDGLLVITVEGLPPPGGHRGAPTDFIVDPKAERLLARFCEGRSVVFDDAGTEAWTAAL